MQMLLKCRIRTIICTQRPTNELRVSQSGGRSRLPQCEIFTILFNLLAGWKGLSFMLWFKWAAEFSGFKHGFGKNSAPLLCLQNCKNQEFTYRTPSSHTLLTEVSDTITKQNFPEIGMKCQRVRWSSTYDLTVTRFFTEYEEKIRSL